MSVRHRFHLVLFLASFGMSLASGMVNYALIFYVRDLFGADKTAIGLISSGLDLFYLGGILVFLRWKKPHPRFLLALASWAMALCVSVYLVFPSWTLTVVFHCLFGLSMALFWPRMMGWLSWNVEGRELGRIMGRFNFSWAFGGILAPWLAGLLVEQSPLWPFWAAVAILITTGHLMLLGQVFYPEFRSRQAEALPELSAAPPSHPTPMRHPARLGVGAAYFLTGALLFIFPAFAKESLGFSESLTGSFLLVRLAVATLGFSLWGRWSFWHFRSVPLVVAMLLSLALILAFPAATEAWQFYVLFAAVGLVFSFLYSFALFHGVAGSQNRERSMTIHEAVLNVGLFLGTMLGGWVAQSWSMAVALVLCAAVFGLTLTVQVVQTLLMSSKSRAIQSS